MYNERLEEIACLEEMTKIYNFFQSDGIVFMPPSYKNLVMPMFGKYVLMFDRNGNEYNYATIEISKLVYDDDDVPIPVFYDKENIMHGLSDKITNYMIKKTLEMIKSSIDDGGVKIFARDMTSTRSLDIEIWKDIDGIDELLVQIDLGLTIKHEIDAKLKT